MRGILLTKGQFTVVDNEDYDLVVQHKWLATAAGGKFYAARKIQTPKGSRLLYLHRFLMRPPDHLVVDHINHNPLDNRRSNLRVCTQC